METFKMKGTTITLNRLLKMMGWCSSGAEANALIDEGLVKVNGVVELRRRNKLEAGAKVEFENQIVVIE
ncbi:MAG: RNA-binding S4 domain-containing protein [Bacteroidetes bacterium]|jgi:ribosome-associated protein|nr:RNA-binding S4 domain-containing protein [Bacteroidota bacterium]MBL0065125.1 RNA-binding S4 domain-containing protein [Bacteroidota bacterium]MBL0138480.1 RNA-binding S4 domain-containing protein [Bacteroidota bacterium]